MTTRKNSHSLWAALFACAAGCAASSGHDGVAGRRGDAGLALEWPDGATPPDFASASSAHDLSRGSTGDLASGAGASGGGDLAGPGGAPDLSSRGAGGVISGGACLSGATGATAIRVRWANAGGTAQVQYE